MNGMEGETHACAHVQGRERQASEELTATAAKLVELKARAAQGEAESVKLKQQIQSLRQEYRSMTIKLDDKVRTGRLERAGLRVSPLVEGGRLRERLSQGS